MPIARNRTNCMFGSTVLSTTAELVDQVIQLVCGTASEG